MTRDDFPIGLVVRAKAGRDENRKFVVVAHCDEDNYVFIADGTLRKVDKPKRKKVKHLEPTKAYFTNIGEKLKAGTRVFDSELRKSLIALDEVPGAQEPLEEG